MENLKKLAKENAEKKSYVRKAVSDFMEAWEDVTDDCETIYSSSPLYTRDSQYLTENFHLMTGSKEIKCHENGERWDISQNSHFSKSLSISSLREFFTKLPQAISEIEEKLQKANIENQIIIDKLNEMVELLNK